MKLFKLIENYRNMYKKGTKFFVISESEFIGVKSYVLQSEDMSGKIVVSEEELRKKFIALN
ncbi:hypothetical protein JNUCC23_09365 [Peribacillus sp. JNUCC 23]|uniref:hypothetical protein n=1 Tax=Peribacillus sp. NPDC096379 TaxID=3364393 RepID=UPI000782F50D